MAGNWQLRPGTRSALIATNAAFTEALQWCSLGSSFRSRNAHRMSRKSALTEYNRVEPVQ